MCIPKQLSCLLQSPATTKNVAIQLAVLGGGWSSSRAMTTPTTSIQNGEAMIRKSNTMEKPVHKACKHMRYHYIMQCIHQQCWDLNGLCVYRLLTTGSVLSIPARNTTGVRSRVRTRFLYTVTYMFPVGHLAKRIQVLRAIS